ncbi:MAG: isochorismatase family protein [Actinocatenispora sp.]
MTNTLRPDAVLILIDVQVGFDDPVLGTRNNPDAEANIARLVTYWARTDRPVVRVRHVSSEPGSPLGAALPGQAFKPEVADVVPRLEIVKQVHSAFHGTPDLHAWLSAHGARQLVIAGIQTNRCVETTARVGSDLGYEVVVAIDATFTFDATTPDGDKVTADELARATAASLHPDFGTVCRTAALLA